MSWEAIRQAGGARRAALAGAWSETAGELRVELPQADARPLAAALTAAGCRLAAVFAEDRVQPEGRYYVYYVFEDGADARYLLARAPVAAEAAAFASVSAELPAVNWQEREIQDWFGLTAKGHPNPRRVALHDNWPEVHPLRKDFAIDTVLPPLRGERHVYRPTLGEGVLQIPVGPIHAGIIEPGHFSFAVAGEPILYLQLRMFYVHKGIEKRFEGMAAGAAVFLAESVSGDSSFSHAVAYCQAIERAAGQELPLRARRLRAILLELERVHNHVGDIGAIVNDVGFAIGLAHAARLREMLLTAGEALTGSRTLRGVACPGGLRRDWTAAQTQGLLETVRRFEAGFEALMRIVDSSDSTRDRLLGTGILPAHKARDLGVVGVAGRASGVDRDVRRDHPYAAYDELAPPVAVYTEGDVLRRVQVRVDEIRASLGVIRGLAARLEPGAHRAPLPALAAGACALGAVEGWRGEILYWIRIGDGGRLERCKVKDPSLSNWPAVVEAVQGNIVPDFPVINKSFNLSYSGTDR